MNFFEDFMSKKEEFVLSGKYYPRKPVTTADTSYPLNYEIVDARRNYYAQVVQNVIDDGAMLSIRTNTPNRYKVKGYISTQDGGFWQITEVTVQPQNDENKEALRLFKTTAQTTYLIRLTEVDNPMELS